MLSILLLPLALTASVYSQQSEPQEVAALRDAPAALDRFKLIAATQESFVFDFANATAGVVTGAAGHIVTASVSSFPAVVNNGIAMAVGFLGPCGMNTPHTHPRATEMLYVVNGTLTSGMIPENGGAYIQETVCGGSAMLFPRGSVHFQYNDGCEPLVFVSALNDEDPGVVSMAQRLFGLPTGVVSASLGDIGVQEVAGIEAKIPDNVAFGTDECLQRCGIITRPTQPTNERQPRNSANALPAGFSGPPAAAAPMSTSAAQPTWTSSTARSLITGANFFDAISDVSNPTGSRSSSGTSHATIALAVIVALLITGYAVIGAMFFMRRRRHRELKERTFIRPDMVGRAQVPLGEQEASERETHEAYNTPYDS